MSRLCIGFEVHQPYRLDPEFTHQNGSTAETRYFNHINREILERVAEKCYVPATAVILESLDKGFKCAFSLSGTLIEQLEAWRPDVLELFGQVASHKNAEFLAQTYFHSIASLFDLGEFEEQVRLHKKLLRSTFGVTPRVMENTEFLFNNDIARSASKMGFTAIYTEGVERVLGWRSPDYVYSCNGVKVLMRNYRLSDDVAFRFNDRGWDQHPLMADKFAGWVAASPGDYVNVFVDYETFGEHHWRDSGILEFLRWLTPECLDRNVEFILPSGAAGLPARDELSVEETISWADVEKDASAWLGNTIQHTALKAIRRARAYAKNKKMWRYLQTSDHFYYMASKFGSCAEVHNYFSPDACKPFDSFANYMSILSDFESAAALRMRRKAVAMELRNLPPDRAFSFYTPTAYTGFTAYSLDDLCELLNYVPKDSVGHHLENKDISIWARDVLGDKALAEELGACTSRLELIDAASRRRDALWKSLR